MSPVCSSVGLSVQRLRSVLVSLSVAVSIWSGVVKVTVSVWSSDVSDTVSVWSCEVSDMLSYGHVK